MLIILQLYLLSVICCLIIDISGAVNSVKRFFTVLYTSFHFPSLYNTGRVSPRRLSTSFSLKPLDCSMCMSFWSGLAFLCAASSLNIPYLAACLFIACGARYTTGLIQWLYSLADKALYIANKFTAI